MKATIGRLRVELPREESRGRLQDFVGPAQLFDFTFELFHLRPLVGGHGEFWTVNFLYEAELRM